MPVEVIMRSDTEALWPTMRACGGALPKEIEKAESEPVAFPAHPKEKGRTKRDYCGRKGLSRRKGKAIQKTDL
jgi:hypothetical protein